MEVPQFWMLATLTPVTQLYAETDWLTTHYQPGGKVWLFRFRFRFYRFFFQQCLWMVWTFFFVVTMNENEMSSRIRLDVLFSAGVGRSKSFWLSPGSLHQLRSTALREVAVLKDRQFQMPRETRIISSGFGCWQMNRDIFWHIATSRVATAYNTDYQYQCRSRQPTCFSKLAVTSIAWV